MCNDPRDLTSALCILLFLCLFTLGAVSAHAAGAFALDENKGQFFGWGLNKETMTEAEDAALTMCEKQSSFQTACHIVLRFYNECAMYYVDKAENSDISSWGKGDTLNHASSRALNKCWELGGTQCTERIRGCDTKPEKSKKQTSRKTTSSSIQSSLVLLIDVSGSMNAANKLKAAKKAAIKSIRKAISPQTEIAVLAFAGSSCANPIKARHDFTTDARDLITFIEDLEAEGGTPLAGALEAANVYLDNEQTPSSITQMIILLADGSNGCGNVDATMTALHNRGIIFRHETVGLGIEPFSEAAGQLQTVANATGGKYHYAEDHTQLANVFSEAIDTMSILELIGKSKPIGQKATDESSGKTRETVVIKNAQQSMQSILDTME